MDRGVLYLVTMVPTLWKLDYTEALSLDDYVSIPCYFGTHSYAGIDGDLTPGIVLKGRLPSLS